MAKSAIPLHSYQEEWFRDRSPNKVACWPRQSCKTLTTSAEIADDSFEKIIKGQRSVWYLVSRSYDQSILALDYCKRFFNAYQITLDYHEYALPEAPQDIIREIRLPHGGRIRAMPAKPESMRGPTGSVYLDEFDIRANDIEFWGAVMPITSVPGCRKIITSTPVAMAQMDYFMISSQLQTLQKSGLGDGLIFTNVSEADSIATPNNSGLRSAIKPFGNVNTCVNLS